MHNAFNEHVISEVTRAFRKIENIKPDLRAVLLRANGTSFSAGADLTWMKKMVNYTREENERDAHQLFEMFEAIHNCPVPVIGRINGSAIGGGAGMVACCDISYSVASAKFGFTEVKLGLIPAVISPFVMEKIGRSNCSRYFLTGEKFSSEVAKSIQLISDYFPDEKTMEEHVDNTLKEISNSSPAAVRSAKSLIRNVSNMVIGDKSTMLYVAEQIARIRISKGGQEGLAAFLEKRKPSWNN